MPGEKGYLLNIITAFDNAVYGFVSGFISESTTSIMKFITFFGSAQAFIAISLGMLAHSIIRGVKLNSSKPGEKSILKFPRDRGLYFSLLIIVNLITGSLFNFILKQLFRRPRPELLKMIEIGGYSFPSGHSMTSLIFYGFIIYICLKYGRHWFKYCITVLLSLLVLFIGISRIYLGVHYASDVLGGFIIGTGWLILFIRVYSSFLNIPDH